jgi:nucleolar protein 56
MQLVTTWFGTFLVEEGKVVAHRLFPKDPDALAARLERMDDWKALEEERDLVKGLDEFFVTEPRLERIGGTATTERPLEVRPEDYGFDRDLLRGAMLAFGRRRMRRAVRPEDHIVQAIRAVDDLVGTWNLLLERLREWYGLHFPELTKLVDEERYVDLVAEHGERSAMPMEDTDSVGAELGPEERRAVQVLAAAVRDASATRRKLEAFVEGRMRALAPNVSHLAGPLVGARLLALAGGLEELARMPASTIQLLGAEKALFRHLRTGARPPKHGVLFQHPWVHRAPWWQRGSIARSFAAKIAIAARADAFTRRFLAEELKADVERAMRETARKYPKAPDRGRKKRGTRTRRRR